MHDLLSEAALPETVVVFGGAGFIGTHLMQQLLTLGVRHVISFDIRDPSRPVNGVEYRRGDVRDLSGITVEATAPLVFNLAAVHTTPGHAPWEYYDVNVLGAIEITRFARRHQVRELVFTSSIAVYGPGEAAKDETTPVRPISDYGRSKLQAEQIHLDWLAQESQNRLVIARPAVVFGLGEGGNFSRLATMLKMGFFVYPGRRDTIKSCIYIADLVTWMLVAHARQDRFILFNAAFSERFTIEDIISAFRSVSFENARAFTIPAFALQGLASLLRPLSATGLGIHPDRITKLMVSTNVLPTWAESVGLQTRNRLEAGLADWKAQGGGEFV